MIFSAWFKYWLLIFQILFTMYVLWREWFKWSITWVFFKYICRILFLIDTIKFHCPVPNVVTDEVVKHVYVFFLLGYLCVLLQEYTPDIINVHGNEIFNNNPHKQ